MAIYICDNYKGALSPGLSISVAPPLRNNGDGFPSHPEIGAPRIQGEYL